MTNRCDHLLSLFIKCDDRTLSPKRQKQGHTSAGLPPVLLPVESVLHFRGILGAIFGSTLRRANFFHALELSMIQINKAILSHRFILINILRSGKPQVKQTSPMPLNSSHAGDPHKPGDQGDRRPVPSLSYVFSLSPLEHLLDSWLCARQCAACWGHRGERHSLCHQGATCLGTGDEFVQLTLEQHGFALCGST